MNGVSLITESTSESDIGSNADLSNNDNDSSDDNNEQLIDVRVNIGEADSEDDFEMDMHDSAMVTHDFSQNEDSDGLFS